MDYISGKRRCEITAPVLAEITRGFSDVLVDVGTGDGRYIRHMARADPRCFAIGLDACAENMYRASRTSPANSLFVVANALAMPLELNGVATRVSVNFPWGSLLSGLLDGDSGLLDGLQRIARPGAVLTIRLNSAALAQAGWMLEAGSSRVGRVLQSGGFEAMRAVSLGRESLRELHTDWASRTAFGRDPRAVQLSCRIPVSLERVQFHELRTVLP